MPQKPVELILLRQLASSLAIPIFIVDVEGNPLFHNESAETLLGRRHDETSEIPLAEWSTVLAGTAEDGSALSPEKRPLTIVLEKRLPTHRVLRIRGFDGVPRQIGMTAFPIEGYAGRHLGAAAIFWPEDRR